MDKSDIKLDAKLGLLKKRIKALKNAIVAFSGGIDSTLVLKLCKEELGKHVIAVTSVSASYPKSELLAAKKIAKEIGVKHITVKTSEIKDENYVRNSSDRCYFCKKNLYLNLVNVAKKYGYKNILNGANAADMLDHRPGMKAAEEFSVIAPLKDAGITKQEIVQLAKKLRLSNWNKPPSPCLASRIPYGTRVTRDRLKMIEAAEEYIKKIGIRQFRVRFHNECARIETEQKDISKVLTNSKRIINRFKKIGFGYVALDLNGFRSGSLNEVIKR